MEAGPRREATDALTPFGPTRFGRYTLLGRLGSGGMADALLAMMHGELGFQKLVVLKRMHASLAQDEHFVKMFLDEARLAARLSHPNVVQTTEVGEVDGQYFIAMEYLEGQSLDRIARRYASARLTLPLPLLLRVLCDALEGLHYAHELRDYNGTPLEVVHRDVTPSNLFVTYDGAAKVLDFGIAKASIQDEATRTGMLKGKLAYMSPEQFYADPIDRRSDVWSMGVVVWELAAGRRLFKGTNDAATYTNITSARIPLVTEHRPDAPPALDAVIARALARPRDDRYPDAEAMRRDLEAVLRSDPVHVGRTDIAAELRRVFGETIEGNRRAVREYASLGAPPPGTAPLGLSSLGVLKPGAGGTLAPTATGINLRDLGLADEALTEQSGVAPVLRQGTRIPPIDDDVTDASEPTQVNPPGFVRSAFDAVTPIVPTVRVDSPDPPPPVVTTLAPMRLAQPLRPKVPTPSPSPPVDATFGPLPSALAPPTAPLRGAALWWLIALALVAFAGTVLWSARAPLRASIEDAWRGPPPDPLRQGSFRLHVLSNPPGMTVLDQGHPLGRTPLDLQVQRAAVATHPHAFVLEGAGYLSVTAVQPDTLESAATLRVTMVPVGGSIGPPGVQVQVNHRMPLHGR